MICIKRDVTDPAAAPLLMAQGFQTNPDGSTSIRMPDGTFAYQIPSDGGDTYGKFAFSHEPLGAYQECKVEGQLVSFWTRAQDVPYVYSWMTVPDR